MRTFCARLDIDSRYCDPEDPQSAKEHQGTRSPRALSFALIGSVTFFPKMSLKTDSKFAVVCFEGECMTPKGKKDKKKQLTVDLVVIKWLSNLEQGKNSEIVCMCAYPPQEKLHEVENLVQSEAPPEAS